jgi:NAD(P)-dependent dehydrogenase (short-subunit alcohol dehydrogenase family)
MAPKVVLVTGANTGIGYETVKAFLQSPNSYRVYLGSRSLEKGKEALQKLQSEAPNTSNTIEVVQIDVSSDESIQKAFETIEKGSGKLDVLINNAGKFEHSYWVYSFLTYLRCGL